MTDLNTHPLRAILDRLRDIERREREERQALLKSLCRLCLAESQFLGPIPPAWGVRHGAPFFAI